MSKAYKSEYQQQFETHRNQIIQKRKSSANSLTSLQKQLILKLTIRLIFAFSSVLLTFLSTNKRGYILTNSMIGLILCEIAIFIFFSIIKAIGQAIAAMIGGLVILMVLLPIIALTKKQPELPLIPPPQKKSDMKAFVRYIGQVVLRLVCLEVPTYFLLYFVNSRTLTLAVVFFGVLLGEVVANTIKIQFNNEVMQILQKNDLKLTTKIKQRQQ